MGIHVSSVTHSFTLLGTDHLRRNYKPSDSDLEDDDDDDDDDDPANWFEDDQDDGRKGQDIVEPDDEDYSHIIRIDDSRIFYPLPIED